MLLRSAILTLLVLAAVGINPRTAVAQGPGNTNIFGGWSFLHLNDANFGANNYSAGFEVGINQRLTASMSKLTIGAKLQFGSTKVTAPLSPELNVALSQFLFGMTFGPPPNPQRKVWVFGSAYLGPTRRTTHFVFLNRDSIGNAFTFQPGAGVGFFLTPQVGLQLTGEMPIMRFDGDTQTGLRFSVGISVRLR
jgi:hypothetical protein